MLCCVVVDIVSVISSFATYDEVRFFCCVRYLVTLRFSCVIINNEFSF